MPIFVCSETMDEMGLDHLRNYPVEGLIRTPIDQNLNRLQEMFKGLTDLDQRRNFICEPFLHDQEHWEGGGWLASPPRDVCPGTG